MNKRLQALYGLKWNPFNPAVPTEALYVSPQLDSFCHRVGQLAIDGGFAMISGAPGSGKSAALRVLALRLEQKREIKVGLITRPQASVTDFYREVGELFGVEMHANNRWGSTKALRARWQTFIDTTLSRPVLIIDEAQEVKPAVLAELRLLTSARLDSEILLTVVLAGDGRLVDRLKSDELLPLASRMRVRLIINRATPDELQTCLRYSLTQAGAPTLMNKQLISTLADHAAGNARSLMIMADELLSLAAERDASQIDEGMFFELYTPQPEPRIRKRS
jgi:type II secretory pathway predicted ATPase ExeA